MEETYRESFETKMKVGMVTQDMQELMLNDSRSHAGGTWRIHQGHRPIQREVRKIANLDESDVLVQSHPSETQT